MVIDFSSLITDDLLGIFQDGIDQTITSFGQPVKLIYPPTKTTCSVCSGDSIGKKPSSFVQSGGSVPNFVTGGGVCSACGGTGIKETSATETITLKIYWNSKEFIKMGVKIDLPDTAVQTVGYMIDLPKVKKAMEAIMVSDLDHYVEWKFRRIGDAVPYGFKQERYFIQFWDRV